VTKRGQSRCPAHDLKRRYYREHPRGSASQRGYGAAWRKTRAAFLAANPLCAACAGTGRTVAATVVDHVVPHSGDQARFWDSTNWQPLCKRCHDRKTARQGRWGKGGQNSSVSTVGTGGRPTRARCQIGAGGR